MGTCVYSGRLEMNVFMIELATSSASASTPGSQAHCVRSRNWNQSAYVKGKAVANGGVYE